MKIAALDLGSNTFLCLIAEITKNGLGEIISDSVEIVRLGQDVDKTKRLHPDALLRAEACLSRFKKIIERHQPEKILAMATSAARDSVNQNELFEIGRKLNIPIEIIPGDQEASITYQGSVSGLSDNKVLLVVDIGGGSTEFICGDGMGIRKAQSLDIGCVRLTEKIISKQPTSDVEMQTLETVIIDKLSTLNEFPINQIEEILAVAGTPTALVAAMLGGFDAKKIDGFKLTRSDLLKWKDKFQGATIEEKIRIGIPAGRADVILVGVIILLKTLEKFNKLEITVSTRGVRHGIALEMARRYLS